MESNICHVEMDHKSAVEPIGPGVEANVERDSADTLNVDLLIVDLIGNQGNKGYNLYYFHLKTGAWNEEKNTKKIMNNWTEQDPSPIAKIRKDKRLFRRRLTWMSSTQPIKHQSIMLKQASRQWNKRFDEEIKKFGFTQNRDEPCVYRKASGSNVVFLILYVDDILIMGNNIPRLKEVKDYLGKLFYEKFNITNANKGYLPMEVKHELSNEMCASTPEEVAYMKKVPYARSKDLNMYSVRWHKARCGVCSKLGQSISTESREAPLVYDGFNTLSSMEEHYTGKQEADNDSDVATQAKYMLLQKLQWRLRLIRKFWRSWSDCLQ
ncbi:retrotransposon protein, putative, ty1-copia subclass [Tanacetum coccineum]